MRTARVIRVGAGLLIMTLTAIAGEGPSSSLAQTAYAPVSSGSLDIRTEPDTSVLWDDNLLGTTDEEGLMTISAIPLGRYSITLRKEGFESATRELDIAPASQSLEIILLKRPASEMASSVDSATDAETPALDLTLPDPFARRSTPLISVAFATFLVAIAAGVLWLGRRRRMEPEEEIRPQPDGPRVVMANESRTDRRPPGFYEDLRQRETMLENLGERGTDRPRPKVIELPVADHRSAEGDG